MPSAPASAAPTASAVRAAGGGSDTDPGPDCTIVGTNRNDVLHGTPYDDVICALGGNDVVQGGGGNDLVYGGWGRDILIGGAGYDTLIGGPGNDVLIDTNEQSWLDGGDGQDRCIAVQSSTFLGCERASAIP
jgi:Ca2+-binding RTX toxin-like protein